MATAAEIATAAIKKLDRFESIASSLRAHHEAEEQEQALGEAPDELTEPAAVWRKAPDREWRTLCVLGPELAKQLGFRHARDQEGSRRLRSSDDADPSEWLWKDGDRPESFANASRWSNFKWACNRLRRLLLDAGADGSEEGAWGSVALPGVPDELVGDLAPAGASRGRGRGVKPLGEVFSPLPPAEANFVREDIREWSEAAGQLLAAGEATSVVDERRARRQLVLWIASNTENLADWAKAYNLVLKPLREAARRLSVRCGGAVEGIESIEPALYVLDDLDRCFDYPVPDEGEPSPIAGVEDVRANLNGDSGEIYPVDPDERDLLLMLKQGVPEGSSEAGLARQVTDEPIGADVTAQKILARLRRKRDRGTVTW